MNRRLNFKVSHYAVWTKGEQKLVSLETRDGKYLNIVLRGSLKSVSNWCSHKQFVGVQCGGVQEFTINPTLGGDLLLPLQALLAECLNSQGEACIKPLF